MAGNRTKIPGSCRKLQYQAGQSCKINGRCRFSPGPRRPEQHAMFALWTAATTTPPNQKDTTRGDWYLQESFYFGITVRWTGKYFIRIKETVLLREALVQYPGGADERDVREGLRKIAQMFATRTELLGIKAQMI